VQESYIPARRTRRYSTRVVNWNRDLERIPASWYGQVQRRWWLDPVTSDRLGCTVVVAHSIDTNTHAHTHFKQVANLLWSGQLSLLPSPDGKWVLAYGLRCEGVVRLIEAFVEAWLAREMDGSNSSCQSAATSEIAKRCWSCTSCCKPRYSKYPDFYLRLYCNRPYSLLWGPDGQHGMRSSLQFEDNTVIRWPNYYYGRRLKIKPF